ncbi:MAG TPA: sulfatase-like hydrolase/transferase [Myxococcota bacterium]|nr:sulfatase-like hydrolase/transferase [Myxococcota bacterium]
MITLMLMSCFGEEPAETTEPEAAVELPEINLVVVTLDTTRADRIGAYGHEAARTETIDGFAARGQRFDHAVSPVPLTIPAHGTLFTGMDPYHHGIRNNGSATLPATSLTLAEILKDSGYATAASVAAYVTTDLWGFDQGFDAYYDDIEESLLARHNLWKLERPADQVLDDAIGWLQSDERPKDRPFFLWVHLYDPHEPLRPPEGYQDGDAYDGEIAFADDQLARLEATIGELGAGDQTLWVIVGDHGEGFGDHDEMGHGLFLYNSTQRVPLIIAGPGIEPSVISEPAGLVDVMPTVLTALGLPVPAGLDGQPQPGGSHPLYLESYQLQERYGYAPHLALVDGDRKLIDTPRPELYAVDDLAESQDLAAEEPERVAAMQALLQGLGATPPHGRTTIDAETLARLAALGYVSSGEDMRTDEVLPDPKDKLHVLRAIQEGRTLAEAGDYEAAIAVLEGVAKAEPDLVIVRERLARICARSGDQVASLRWVEEALSIEPDSARVLGQAVLAHSKAGDHQRALELAEHGLEVDPGSSVMAELKLAQMERLSRAGDAVVFGEGFLARNPGATNVAGMLGVFYGRMEDMEKAEPLLRLSVASANPPRWVNYTMAKLASGAGAQDEAIGYLRAELHEYPDNRKARLLLVRLLSGEGRYTEALPVVDVMLKVREDDMQLILTKAQLHFNMKQYDETEAALSLAAAIDPEEPELLLLKANLLDKQGKKTESKEAFEAAKAAKAKRMEAAKPADKGGAGAAKP